MDDHDQFVEARRQRIDAFAGEARLNESAHAFLQQSLHSQYSYNFDWMGLPVIQYPQDLMALQEIIWRIKPELIIETGVARGGSLVFYASMLELLGGNGRVLGIDIDIREHNKRRILEHPMHPRIDLIEGSSVSADVHDKVREMARPCKSVLVCLDSNHAHAHVLQELRLYAPLVTPDSYCIVFDTIIEYMPEDHYPDRPWAVGNSPATAITAYLEENTEFEIDRKIDSKLLVSAALGGYLHRKDGRRG